MMSALRIQRLMYVVGFLDLLGVMLIIPQLVVHLRRMGMTPLVGGVVRSFYGILQLVSAPLAGRCSDRWGRRPLLLLGLVLSAVGYVTLGASQSLLVLVVSRIIAGIFKHTTTLCKAVLADVTSPDERSQVFGKYGGALGLGVIVGPVLGGHLTELEGGGFSLVCNICAVIFLVNFVLCLVLLPGVLPSPQPVNSQPTQEHSICVQRQPSQGQPLLEQLVLEQPGQEGCGQGQPLTEQLILGQSEQKLLVQKEVETTNGHSLHGESDQKQMETESLSQVFQFMKDVDWQVFGDIFIIDFFMTFASYAFRSSFVLLIDQMFGASPKTIGYIMSFQIGAVTGLGQSIPAVAGMTTPILAGLAQEISVYGPGIIASLSAFMGVTLAGYMAQRRKTKVE
ncbi:major facilitator superfamily domain-containing protein 9-like isoform X2 [Homarus americanus]|uniref:major facilitator superfamily domain-containing protein 9-like isoform X2 n=1 Tax=Homarus americanus TaxID=6706 RepID=UPI001C44BB3A|nr:major facilitator superfamily domain-containing protein 9-like isoform X2 [Homarus americanus]